MLGIAEITLQTDDLDGLTAFYAEVIGLPVLQRQSDRVWLAAGSQGRLGLWRPGAKEFDDRPGAHVHFALAATPAELDAITARLEDRGTDVRGPVEHNGGDRSVYWTDPAGHRGEAWDLLARGHTIQATASGDDD